MDKDVFTSARFQKEGGGAEQETEWLTHVLEQACHLATALADCPATQLEICAARKSVDWLVSACASRLPGVAAAAANALEHATRSDEAATALAELAKGRVVFDMLKVLTKMPPTLAKDHEAAEAAGRDVFSGPTAGSRDLGGRKAAKQRQQRALLASQLCAALGNIAHSEAGRGLLGGKGCEALPQIVDVFKSVRAGGHVAH